MAKNLVIVESPTKAKTIGRYLGDGYKVIASAGHLRDLPSSRLSVDIENNFTPKYTNITGKADIIKTLKTEAAKADKVYLATDPDREGEAISWHIEYLLGIDNKEICRVTFHEITRNAVLEAFRNPRTVDLGLVDAYQARRVLDRIVGYKISPVLWKKVRKGLSAGRVQSAATRLICDREDEIDKFESKEYWTVDANLLTVQGNAFTAKFYGRDGKKYVPDNEEKAEEIRKSAEDGTFTVKSIKSKVTNKSPYAPFITSTLQQEASKKLGFSASKTMNIVQGLYEGVQVDDQGLTGLVTYIRTDSTRISDEAQAAAKKYIADTYGEKFLPPYKRVFKNKNAAQDAHEAIRPSHIEYTPESIKTKLTSDQFRLYKLIFERFIASQMADAVYDVCNVDIEVDNLLFKAAGSTLRFAGYTKLYKEAKEDKNDDGANQKLPEMNEGDVLTKESVTKEQHFTQPPSRYTEASLVKAMEELGIGRPSTYASILEVIQKREYVAKEKKLLYPTELGRCVNTYLLGNFSDIVDVAFTAQVENNLDDVEEGNKIWTDVVRDFYAGLEKELNAAAEATDHVKIPDEISDVPCDKCGRMMVVKSGKFGKFLACPGYPECKNTKTISENVGAKCPVCGKELIYRKSGKTGKKYISCTGYPECKFISWNVPTEEKCPECGAYLEIVNGKKNKFLGCSNKECKFVKYFTKTKKNSDKDKTEQ